MLALCSLPALAAPSLPEPVLHSTASLCAKVAPASEAERQLLRLEYRAAQIQATERETLADITIRMARMGKSIAELNGVISALPASTCTPPLSPACPAAEHTSSAPDLPWASIGGAGVAGLALLALFLRRRSRPRMVEGDAPAPDELEQTTEPHVSTVSALQEQWSAKTAKKDKPEPEEPMESTLGPETFQSADDFAIDEADLSLELADVMVTMGLAGGAAQTLEGHIRQHPRQALIHWLKLLDVYRRFGQREEFDKAALELQQHFNVAPPPWQQPMRPTMRGAGLEDFPHTIGRIQELWPRKSCAQYLNRLLDDNRGGTRTGFPQGAIDDILVLLNILRG